MDNYNPFEAINKRLERIEHFLSQLHHVEPAKDDPEADLLTVDEAAKLLNLARATVYNLVSKRKIPVFKKRSRLYFSKAALLDWIKAGKKSTVDELATEANEELAALKKGAGNA
jgi:excisionase family DNA binding protein